MDLIGAYTNQNTGPAETRIAGVTTATFKDRTTPTTPDGTPAKATFFNDLAGEIVAAIKAAGLTPTAGALQLLQAIQAIANASGIPAAQKGAANGVASLDANGQIPAAQIPSLALERAQVVATQAAMLALTNVQEGDIAKITNGNAYVLAALPASVPGNWIQLTSAAATVPAATDTVPGVSTLATAADLAAGTASKVLDAQLAKSQLVSKTDTAPQTMSGNLVFPNVSMPLFGQGTNLVLNPNSADGRWFDINALPAIAGAFFVSRSDANSANASFPSFVGNQESMTIIQAGHVGVPFADHRTQLLHMINGAAANTVAVRASTGGVMSAWKPLGGSSLASASLVPAVPAFPATFGGTLCANMTAIRSAVEASLGINPLMFKAATGTFYAPSGTVFPALNIAPYLGALVVNTVTDGGVLSAAAGHKAVCTNANSVSLSGAPAWMRVALVGNEVQLAGTEPANGATQTYNFSIVAVGAGGTSTLPYTLTANYSAGGGCGGGWCGGGGGGATG